MKIKEYKSKQYGLVNYVEVAGIDQTKVVNYFMELKPSFGYSTHMGEDSRLVMINKNDNISDREKIELGFCINTIFCFPLEEANKDWHIKNKDFAKNDEFLTAMIKSKTCPISVPDVDYMKWFVGIYELLNEEWKEQNSEYMKVMDEKILKNNNRMLDGFKNQDIKEIRSSVKYGADINYENDNKTPLHYAVENKSKELLSYLINKKVKIPDDFNIEENEFCYILIEYKNRQQKKKIKMS